MLIDFARAGDFARLGRQQSTSGVTDMASFGFATSGANLAASSSITLAVGASVAPETAFGAEIAARATFLHAIDAPTLPFVPSETIVSGSIGANFGGAVIPPVETPAAPAAPVDGSPAPTPLADEAAPLPVAYGSSTSPEILQQPVVGAAASVVPQSVFGDQLQNPLAPDATILAQQSADAVSSNLVTPSELVARSVDAAVESVETVVGSATNLVVAPVETLAPLVTTVAETANSAVKTVTDTLGEVVAEVPTLTGAIANAATDTVGAVVAEVPALTGAITETATATLAAVPEVLSATPGVVAGTVGAVGDVADVLLKGADPDAGIATLGELLDSESAFEITNPADGAVVFSSFTAPVVDALEPVTHPVEPLVDTVGGLVEAALPLSGDDHDDHGLGHALGGLFDHG